MEVGFKSVRFGNKRSVGYPLSDLLIRQEFKPGEVLLGGVAAFSHVRSLLRPVWGEAIRPSAKNTGAELLGQQRGSSWETGQEHVQSYRKGT